MDGRPSWLVLDVEQEEEAVDDAEHGLVEPHRAFWVPLDRLTEFAGLVGFEEPVGESDDGFDDLLAELFADLGALFSGVVANALDVAHAFGLGDKSGCAEEAPDDAEGVEIEFVEDRFEVGFDEVTGEGFVVIAEEADGSTGAKDAPVVVSEVEILLEEFVLGAPAFALGGAFVGFLVVVGEPDGDGFGAVGDGDGAAVGECRVAFQIFGFVPKQFEEGEDPPAAEAFGVEIGDLGPDGLPLVAKQVPSGVEVFFFGLVHFCAGHASVSDREKCEDVLVEDLS